MLKEASCGLGGDGLTTSMAPSHVVYGASFHVPSPCDNAEWFRELEAAGAKLQDFIERGNSLANWGDHTLKYKLSHLCLPQDARLR